ncbi:MAG TPA: VWA domain-containing protein [bacterium]|nr:VWA domain-containing protein [bacterium]
MTFADPSFLLLFLIALPALILFHSKGAPLLYSSLEGLKTGPSPDSGPRPVSAWRRHIPLLLRLTAASLMILALARPQTGRKQTEILSEGVDIILTLDTSGSMRAMDFTIGGREVTRLDAVKAVVSDFLQRRPGDRLGMVVFGEQAFTQAPLTLDHDLLQTLLQDLTIGMAGDATAIGSAVGVSVNRLKDLKAKSKIVVLLTDGRSNAGDLTPKQAAEAAAAFGVKIYTIGVGSEGPAPFVIDSLFGPQTVYQEADLDEPTLQEIAEITHARYFRAKDTKSLSEIYGEIDRLEKSQAKVKEYMEYEERFSWFLIPGLSLLLAEIVLTRTWLRKIP